MFVINRCSQAIADCCHWLKKNPDDHNPIQMKQMPQNLSAHPRKSKIQQERQRSETEILLPCPPRYSLTRPLIEQQFHSFGSSCKPSRKIQTLGSNRSKKTSISIMLDEYGSVNSSFQDNIKDSDLELQRMSSMTSSQLINKSEKQLHLFKEWLDEENSIEENGQEYKISRAVQLRMKNKNMANLLMHKLEDYRIFNDLDSSRPSKKHNTYCKGSFTAVYSSSPKSTHVCYYRFPCKATDLLPLLKLLNSHKSLSILHSINKTIQVPCLSHQIHQCHIYHPSLNGKNVINITKQLDYLSYQEDQDQEFAVIVDYSVDEGERNGFEKIVKIQMGFRGQVEIYVESCEDVRGSQWLFFQQKFKQFEDYLRSHNLISTLPQPLL